MKVYMPEPKPKQKQTASKEKARLQKHFCRLKFVFFSRVISTFHFWFSCQTTSECSMCPSGYKVNEEGVLQQGKVPMTKSWKTSNQMDWKFHFSKLRKYQKWAKQNESVWSATWTSTKSYKKIWTAAIEPLWIGDVTKIYFLFELDPKCTSDMIPFFELIKNLEPVFEILVFCSFVQNLFLIPGCIAFSFFCFDFCSISYHFCCFS